MNDITIYNKRMRASMQDKLFFIDYIKDIDVIVDVGCADGSLLMEIIKIYPKKILIGIDTNKEMIALAREKSVFILFLSDSTILKRLITRYKKSNFTVALIFSSVLHEISNKRKFINFYSKLNTDCIIIRDMMFIDTTNSKINKFENWGKIPNHIRNYYLTKGISTKNLVQSLFKSYYSENIETELPEDYFSLQFSDLIPFIRKKYTILYYKHYLLPYWQNKILNDYNIDLTGIYTHLKLIMIC